MATNDSKKTPSSSKQQPVKKKSQSTTSKSSSQSNTKKKPTSQSNTKKKPTSQSSAKKKPTSQSTAKKKPTSQSSAKKKPTSQSTAKKKPTSQSSAKKKVASKSSKMAGVKAATKAPKKKSPKGQSENKQKVQAVKRPQSTKRKSSNRKLNNLEVRNSHASQNRKRKKIKFVKPQRRVNEPHIYDEAKYLKSLKKTGKKNLMGITTMFGVLFLLSLVFVMKLEITHTRNGNNLVEYAQNNYTETTSVESTRGTIYDTNGEALAINLEVYDLVAVTDKNFECNIDKTYQNCALQADQTETASAEMAKALGLDSDAQAYIKERLDYGVSNGKYEVSFGSQGKNITLSQKKALEKLDYPWLRFDPQELRFYPYGDFASYIIGYTQKDEDTGDIKGALGVEKALDGHLKGQDGVETALFDKYGIELTEEQQSSIPKIDGTDVYLTLDTVIQTYLENSMEKALSADGVSDINYEGLFTIVMDAKTGDILAAQSYPSFDPNVRKIENYTNYFTNYCFEPGSTFKAATVAAADEAGVWNDTITEPTGERNAGTWGGQPIRDWYRQGWGNITWAQGFYLSSNTVMTYIMDQIPKDFWIDFVTNKLLIGTPVETQFFETPSCVFNPKYDVEYATTSFGQGMTVNVLQLLRMYSALIEDGTMVTPHIVKSIKDSDTGEEIYSDDSLEVVKNVVSKETSQHIRDLLRGVVTYEGPNEWQTSDDGTGYNYKGSDYDIGMKTGTAQMVGDNGQYEENKYIYSSIATAPIEDPQLLVYTAVIAPEQNKTNISYLAFPQYIKEVLDNSLSYLNSENRAVDLDQEVSTYTVGNFIGKDMSEVTSDKVIKIGTGAITNQYPKRGQTVSSDQKVIVFGTDDVTFPDLKGYSYNEAVAVCNALEVTCSFSNSGTKVEAVTNEGEKKYKIKME